MNFISSYNAFLFLKNKSISQSEEFIVICLTTQKKVIASEIIFKGTVDSCPVHPREVFRFAIQNNSHSILVAHNHPYGDVFPSESDIQTTKRLIKVGQIIGIPLLDHIIFGQNKYYSFKDEGII